MKKRFSSIKSIILVSALIFVCHCKAKNSLVNFHISDDLGNPVSNVVVSIATFDRHIPGEDFGVSKDGTWKATTDIYGKVEMKFPCKSMIFSYSVSDPLNRFYGEYENDVRFAYKIDPHFLSTIQTEFKKEIFLKLKSIKNPIPLGVARFWGLKRPMPISREGVGFDFFKGDWVTPHGSGEKAHIIFTRLIEKDTPTESLTKFIISFPNEGDGIYVSKCLNSKRKGSDLLLPYVVPDVDFIPSFSLTFQYKDNMSTSNEDKSRLYYIRFNSVLDEKGELISAQYAAIPGEFTFIMGKYDCPIFLYYVNPNINDKNMEFDKKNNLMAGRFSKWLIQPKDL